MSENSRRSFLKQVSAAGAVAGFAPLVYEASAATIAPLHIGLSQYSLRQLFRGKKLTIYDYPAFARDQFGITSIDVWDGGFPGDHASDPKFFEKVKQSADKAGSDIFLYMAGVVQAHHAEESKRLENAKSFFEPVDRAAKLDCQYVRVFLKAADGEDEQSLKLAAATLKPIADYAGQKKIKIVIEPGASKNSQRGDYLKKLADQMDHPHCKLMPDFGKFVHGTELEGTRAMMPQTEVVSAKSHNFDEQGHETGFDYFALLKAIYESGFNGIIAIEYEGRKLPPAAGVLATKSLIEKAYKKIG